MSKLGATRYLAQRPNTGCRCLKPLIDLHVSPIRQFDASQFQSNICCVRSTARCDQQMTALQRRVHAILFDKNSYCLARLSRCGLDACIKNNVDAFGLEETTNAFTHVLVFAMQQPVIPVDHGYLAAETSHRLR